MPEATDADNDSISFVFSAPLNASGEWATGYNDAGVYNVTITAFDGKTYAEEAVTLTVTNVNRPPQLSVEDVTVAETELVTVKPVVSDPDKDTVSIEYSEPLNASGQWQTGYDDAGEHSASVIVHDGEFEKTAVASIIVKDTNRLPIIDKFSPDAKQQTINENQELSFHVSAHDPDVRDTLNYTWLVDGERAGSGADFTYVANYTSSGKHDVNVQVSDGKSASAEGWDIIVNNVNRVPSVAHLTDITLSENEELVLNLSLTDLDGDQISYEISNPVGNDGRWIPPYDAAGTYPITIRASDGTLADSTTITLTVLNVDRAPQFVINLSDVSVREASEFRLHLQASDPDGDPIQFSVSGLPSAHFEKSDLIWMPDYSFVSLPQNAFGRMVSRLYLDKLFYPPKKVLPVTVSTCALELCTNQTFSLTVEDTNRLPILESVPDQITVVENDIVSLAPHASDPDGDHVRFYYISPLGRRNGRWKTNFTDAGNYTAIVGASDRKGSVEKNVSIVVENKNRLPTFGKISDQKIIENKTISFPVPATDPDGDTVFVWADGLPSGSEFFDGRFIWTPGFGVANSAEKQKDYVITFYASDQPRPRLSSGSGNFTSNTTAPAPSLLFDTASLVQKQVYLTVSDANRPPVITNISPGNISTTLVGRPVTFSAQAFDPDGDPLTYTWKFGFLDKVTGPHGVRRTFTTIGPKTVTLEVSDGRASVSHVFDVRVGRIVPARSASRGSAGSTSR